MGLWPIYIMFRVVVTKLYLMMLHCLSIGTTLGLGLALRNGGGFVRLQKVAYCLLSRAGNLPPRPGDFLEWE